MLKVKQYHYNVITVVNCHDVIFKYLDFYNIIIKIKLINHFLKYLTVLLNCRTNKIVLFFVHIF